MNGKGKVTFSIALLTDKRRKEKTRSDEEVKRREETRSIASEDRVFVCFHSHILT